MNSSEAAGEAAGQAYQFLHSGVLLDLGLIIVIFLVRAVLLGVTAKAVSRGSADVGRKSCAYTTLILTAVFFIANPTLQMEDLIRPLGVMALVGVLVCKKAFWIKLEEAFFCSLIFCLLCVFIGDFPRRGIDKLYPERVTVNRALASVIDSFATADTNAPPHEPSADILTALVNTTTMTNAGVIGDVLGFLRAGIAAKEQMARLNKIAAEEAMIANMLAGGGTNVHSRASELSAMSELFGKSDAHPPAPPPVQQGTNGTRHGYMETYALAKSTLEQVNRVASNNASIVNMLSGVGPEVGDRREEMEKLHKALLAEAMAGTINLSEPQETLSEEQIASLREAMGANADAGSAESATNGTPAAEMSSAEIQNTVGNIRAAAVAYATEKDKLRKALLEEAMRGSLDMSTNGAPISDAQIARIMATMGGGPDTNTVEGAATTNTIAAVQVTPETIKAALADVRKAAAAYAATAKKLADARASARARALNLIRRGAYLTWSSPYGVRVYKEQSSYWFMRAHSPDRLRRQYRAPWEGALWAVSSSIMAHPVARPTEVAASASKSEMVIVKAKPKQTAKPPPPSPYELLTKEERAKWDAALQKIEVTGFVGSSANLAAIVNGNLIRSGETVLIDNGGNVYTFRLTGISKKSKCQWEPMVGPKKGPASVTVSF